MENKMAVLINGFVLKVKSTESVEYLNKLAYYVSNQIDAVNERNTGAIITERERTQLVAMNIANAYFQVAPELEELKESHKKLQKQHSDLEDENIKLTQEIKELKRQLDEEKIVPLPFSEGRKVK